MSSQALLCIPDARLRSLFSLLLTDGDAQVTTCNDSDEFQRVLVTRFYDLCAITLDASSDLPTFVKTLKYLSPETRILLIAGKDDVEQIVPLFPLGLSEVLLHPINPKRAISIIQKLLAAAQQSAPKIEAVIEGGEGGAGQNSAQANASVNNSQRNFHIVARSPLMRAVVNQLWNARNEALGVILRGEPGTEFELVAREYQAMCGDPSGFLYVLSHSEVTSEGLANAASLDRLNDGVPRTFLIKDLETLPLPQQGQLLDFLRLSKRRKDRERPLRFVFTVAECDEKGRNLDLPFIEELLFVVPTVVKIPALRERKGDIEPLARKLVLDLTALYPEYRVRSMHSSAIEWLAARLWRGNYEEFCTFLRQVVMECPSREVTMAYFTMRQQPGALGYSPHSASKGTLPSDVLAAQPLTATTSQDTNVATTIPPAPKPSSSGVTTSPFGERTPGARLTAKELLATIR